MAMLRLVLFISFSIVAFVHCYESDSDVNNLYKIVETKNGQIRGIKSTSILHKSPFYSFKGIPYAKAPVGDLRFKAPQAVDVWTPVVLDALDYGKSCVQYSFFTKSPLPEDEDCLFLNIFTPANLKPDEKVAVMFFIHGGAFTEGSANDHFYAADFFVERHVILVTINYRLGAFGFLSLGVAEYSGNMGMKDQQLALKWVHANINKFGGDNSKITIFGQSAGGGATHYHVLSSESRNYFRRAISMSGSALNYWALSEQNNHLSSILALANKLKQPTDTNEKLVEFVKQLSVEQLLEFASEMDFGLTIRLKWAPVIEQSDAVQPFLIETPEEIYEKSDSNNIDTMFGYTSDECLTWARNEIFNPALLASLDTNFSFTLPIRSLNISLGSDEYRSIADEIRQFYFGDEHINNETILEYIALLSDMNMMYFIDKSAKKQALKSTGNTFYYRFSVDSTLNYFKRLVNIQLPGSAHGDDMCYLFRCDIISSKYDEVLSQKDTDSESKISYQTIEYVTKLWTNFAKYGSPTIDDDPVADFKPIQNGEIHFVDINNYGLLTALGPNQKSIDFWDGLYEKIAHQRMLSTTKRTEL